MVHIKALSMKELHLKLENTFRMDLTFDNMKRSIKWALFLFKTTQYLELGGKTCSVFTTKTTFNQRFPDALTKASPNQSKLAVVNSTSAFLLVPVVL